METALEQHIRQIIEKHGQEGNAVIPLLQEIQEKYHYLPQGILEQICRETNITPAQIASVSTFYSQFRHSPVGKHIIKVCVGTACHVKGATLVYDAFKRHFRLDVHEDTDKNGEYTIEDVACLGCCTLAPVVQIDNFTFGHVTPDGISSVLEEFREKNHKHGHKKALFKNKSTTSGEIRLGLGSCCIASGSEAVKESLEETLTRTKIQAGVKHVGCVGMCHQVPLLEIVTPDNKSILYSKIKPSQVKKIINTHFKPEGLLTHLRNQFDNWLEEVIVDQALETERYQRLDPGIKPVSAFLDKQIPITTEFRGVLKPLDIEEYKRLGGFTALQQCLGKIAPAQLIEEIKKSGLRGRGGGGFYTGKKWELVASSESQKKYILCNGDEGDPGAFMDRMLLESYPYRIIEGMIIAAYATGAHKGIFYIRAEYPLAVSRIIDALKICREYGYLGNNILHSGFSFDLDVFRGAGAFVCGEETALIASIEGDRGNPRYRPPYPAEKGLWGYPTIVNNAETYATVPWIIKNGSEEFIKTGSENSKGTKVFALAGKINRGGLIEVPMGITIREIVEDIGGGIADGKKFKAVQIGGPSGGCIPEHMANIPVDFESLIQHGAMMGSGGLVVLDETDCMVDIAKYFLSFTQDQSCGKCTFCRVGTKEMLDILEKMTSGQATVKDLERLEYLTEWVKKGSLCGLGKTSPNPVITTLQYFREEYEAHIKGNCPAGKCKDLITYSITDECIGCTKCAQKCPADAIQPIPYQVHEIDTEKCIRCDTCRQVCPVDAVNVK
jgi:NADH-quinone oxidoreductase subunit F